jgi:hypothetical protein
MPEPLDDNQLRKYIEAFADGELDVTTNLRVLERMAMSPEATRRVMHQQQLHQLVDRAMREQAPPVPAELAAKIEGILRQPATAPAPLATAPSASFPAPAQSHSPAVLATLFSWPAMAAAAFVVVSALGYLIVISNRPPAPAQVVSNDSFDAPFFTPELVEDRRAKAMGRRHEKCSATIESLMKAEQFGKELSQIPMKVSEYLGLSSAIPQPDLSKLGYEFSGAGRCGLPGGKAVHLVYKPIEGSGRTDSVSLWIRADAASAVNIEEGKLYAATSEDAEHPILVWRRGSAVYYLVGEASSRLIEGAKQLYAGR